VVPLMINPTNAQQTRLWAAVEVPLCVAACGVLYVVGVWVVWGYPWYTCLVLWVVVGPHLITHALLRAASVRYGPESSWPVAGTGAVTAYDLHVAAMRRFDNGASTTGIRNVSCGAPLLLVSYVRHLLCVVAFCGSLAYTTTRISTSSTAGSTAVNTTAGGTAVNTVTGDAPLLSTDTYTHTYT
jgi:hypothetical protein